MSKVRIFTAALIAVALVTVIFAGGFGIRNAQRASAAEAAIAVPPLTGVTEVDMRDSTYVAAHIRVAPGTTVTWTNSDSMKHTVTFRNGGPDSGLMAQGETYRHTFTTPGTYDYYCLPHQARMLGRVTVG